MSKDPFVTSTLPESATRPHWDPAGDQFDTYMIRGKEYTRMTRILGSYTSPQIMLYYGKTGAMSAAAPLMRSGLINSPFLPEPSRTRTPEYDPFENLEQVMDVRDEGFWASTLEEMERYLDAHALRELPPHEAVLETMNWMFHMRAGERYRDHKGRIGRVAHHVKYDHAVGLRVAPLDRLDYLQGLARDLIRWPADLLERFAALGVDQDGLILDLANHALPHAENVYQFIEDFKPEPIAIGLEASVYSEDEEWAGTADEFARYTKSNWEAGCRARTQRKQGSPPWTFPVGMNTATILDDLKTSRFLGASVRYQLSGYARADAIVLMKEQSFHPVPDVDAIMALHSDPEAGMFMKMWSDDPKTGMTGKEIIDRFYEDFTFQNAFYRSQNDLPRALRSRRYAEPKPKKGERKSPF